MESTSLFKNQLALMASLMEATRNDYFSSPDARRGDIVAGANGGTFTFRNNGAGIPFSQMVRAIFPVEGEAIPISELYPIESLIGADLFELHSFVEKEHAIVRFEKGKRVLFNVEPDESAPDGILIRVESKWKDALTMEELPSCMANLPKIWRPVMFFNGEKVDWLKLMNK